jgi:hypothetical protein
MTTFIPMIQPLNIDDFVKSPDAESGRIIATESI